MNKFKKFMIGVVVAAGISCLGGAIACDGAPDFYSLTFEGDGIEYVMKGALEVPDENGRVFESGGKVKEGVEVRFSILQSSNAVGDPVIKQNGVTILPDADGVYSFVISQNTVIEASGLNKVYTVKLSKTEKVLSSEGYSSVERRIEYLDVDGQPLGSSVKIEEGGDFSFRLKASVYYLPGFNVCFGSEILDANSDGVYTVTNVTGDNEINVRGVLEEDGFTAPSRYEKCGKGTADDPYKISRPIDLYYVAALVNSTYSSNYNTAHYILMNDIDMEGEQLYVIGDSSSTSACFCGTFDGNGYTISNFYITDEVVDQESYVQEYLPYVGLFGTVSATQTSPAVIKNLNLSDYEVTVHPGEASAPSFVGSLVGYGVGVQIINCHADGELLASGDNNQIIFMGGLAGLLQSAYLASTNSRVTHDAFVAYSSTNVTVDGTGTPRSAGGIVGNLVTADISAIAYVVNCYSTGSVSGAMHSGGIVGTLGRFASVSNCYATGSITANNNISSSLVTDEYKVAFAGGIVGYAESDSVIGTCYSANGRLSANSSHGNRYQNADDFVGGKAAAGELAIDSAVVVEYGNVKKSAGDTSAVFIDTLRWTAAEWDFSGSLPKIKAPDGNRKITINIKGGASYEESYEKNVSSVLPSMYGWYNGANAMPEYVTSASGRSWGYYFDEELKNKVPYGYVPVAAQTTFYVGFANYSEVAGRYYLNSTDYSNGAYFDLTADGKIALRDGGLTFSGVYSYDGTTVTLYNSCLASLLYTLEEIDGSYFTVIGTKTAHGLKFKGIAVLVDVENSTASNTSYVYKDINLSAVSAIEGFAYGEYLDADGTTYLFSVDGSGVRTTSTGVRQTFTYAEEDGAIVLFLTSGGEWTAQVANGEIVSVNGKATSRKNDFNGVWKKSANSQVSFAFDGVDTVVCTYGNGKQTVSFTVESGRAVFATDKGQYEAYVSQEGFIVINGETYFNDDGFTGSWYMPGEKERIEITFEGIGTNGYGYATVTYAGGVVASVNAQYNIFTDEAGSVLRLFVEDKQYGELFIDTDTNTASGLFYSLNFDSYYAQTSFYLYDSFKGTWMSVSDGIDTVTFNGRTADGTSEVAITSGRTTQRGSYVLTDGSHGTMTVGGNTYEIAFDENTNRVSFKLADGAANSLARRDEWYGVVLYDGETSYTFDGKGYLGGTVSVSDGTTLAYNVAADGSVTVGGNALTATADGFTLGGKTLSFKTGFEGEWLVSGTMEKITIGEVGGDFTANAAYSGGNGAVKLVYNPATGVLSYTEEVNGERLVTEFKLTGTFELSISRRSISGDLYINAMKSEYVDEFRGVYTAEDGSSWTFDGLGNGVYGRGNALFTAADGTQTNYSYKVNTLGLPNISMDSVQVFAPVTEGGYSREDGKAYNTVTADSYYDKIVRVGGGETAVWYVFDGLGELWQRQPDNSYVKAYDYKIVSSSEVELTDAAGKKYKGTLVAAGYNTQLKIEEIKGEDTAAQS